jgi:predicted nucleic acid-binding protein
MIIVDTNVIFEIMRRVADPLAARWWREANPSQLFTTSITEAEIFAGIEIAPDGRRRVELAVGATQIFDRFGGRILPFDSSAARAYGSVVTIRRRMGRPIAELDAQIAAIALCRDALLATRNVGDFAGCGVRLVNPWDAA